jgi:DNA processing protein
VTVRLNRRQRLAWLRLIRSENVGPATFRTLVNEFGGAEAAIDALPMLGAPSSPSSARGMALVIASGLARGIDTAHLASLESGTIAVLAGGIDNVYPPENEELQRAIGERGLLLSERAPGFSPRGKDFPRRNRLISGISLAVIVIEAAERSGSLITARFAGEQGREVFAVPGSPLVPRSTGTNNLLKQGAGLVTSAADIVEALAPILGRPPAPKNELAASDEHSAPPPLPDIGESEGERVIGALGPSPISTS